MSGDGGKCPKCDKLLAPPAMFCTRCGTRVATVAAPSPRVMPPPPTRPVPTATWPSPTPAPVLSYQVPPKLDPVAKPPPRAPSTSSNRSWVVIALLGVFVVKALVLAQSNSRTARPPPPPPRYMLPPPPRMPVSPATPGNTLAVPNPNAPRQIPGTSLSIDANGRVIVAQPTPAAPATPATPAAPSPRDW